MGLIKTAIMSGAAMYGVHELSKGFQNHQANQHQQRSAHNDYNNHDSQPRRFQQSYPQEQRFQRDLNDAQYPDNAYGYADSYARSDSQERPSGGRSLPKGDRDAKRRSASSGPGPMWQGSRSEYYDRTRSEHEGGDYGAPPQYDESVYAHPRRGGGFVEGEVYDDRCRLPAGEEWSGAAGIGASDLLGMLGSQLGATCERRKGKKERSGAEKVARVAEKLDDAPGMGKK